MREGQPVLWGRAADSDAAGAAGMEWATRTRETIGNGGEWGQLGAAGPFKGAAAWAARFAWGVQHLLRALSPSFCFGKSLCGPSTHRGLQIVLASPACERGKGWGLGEPLRQHEGVSRDRRTPVAAHGTPPRRPGEWAARAARKELALWVVQADEAPPAGTCGKQPVPPSGQSAGRCQGSRGVPPRPPGSPAGAWPGRWPL